LDQVERKKDTSPSTWFDRAGGEAFFLSLYLDEQSKRRGKYLSLYSVWPSRRRGVSPSLYSVWPSRKRGRYLSLYSV